MLDFVIFAATFVIFLIVAVIYLYPGTKKYTTIPGPDPVDYLEGNLPDIVACGSLYEFLIKVHADYGSISSFWFGQKMCVSVASPELFQEQAGIFDRPSETFESLLMLTSNESIQVTNGGEGRQRHAAYSRCFSHKNITEYFSLFNNLSKDFVTKWSSWPRDEYIPLQEHMFSFGIKSMLNGLFGEKEFADQDLFDRVCTSCQLCINEIESRFKGEMTEAGGARDKRLNQHKEALTKILVNALNHRYEHRHTVEGALKDFTDEIRDLGLTDSVLQADLMTIFLCGLQATYPLFLWSVYYLSMDVDVQDKARKEVLSVVGNSDDVTFEMVQKLKYLRQVLNETLRMASIVPYTVRVQEFDSVIGGHQLPAGTPVIHALGVVFHEPKIFNVPDSFDPDRFNDESDRHPLSFEPFGFAGRRKCPGYQFSLNEAAVLLALILRSFKMTVAPDQVIIPRFGLITRATDEIWITVKPIKSMVKVLS